VELDIVLDKTMEDMREWHVEQTKGYHMYIDKLLKQIRVKEKLTKELDGINNDELQIFSQILPCIRGTTRLKVLMEIQTNEIYRNTNWALRIIVGYETC
jgi:hypothetical protein